jgi:hypothetical protein
VVVQKYKRKMSHLFFNPNNSPLVLYEKKSFFFPLIFFSVSLFTKIFNMSNSSMPKRAFLLYCPFEPNQLVPNVDNVTMRGCSGQIALEETVNSNFFLLSKTRNCLLKTFIILNR